HYHPDYREIMTNVRSTKRKMDMNRYVASFKLAERNLQRFLDEISECIAHSVSEQVMVPKDDIALTDSGCYSGGCGAGGSCGCKVSYAYIINFTCDWEQKNANEATRYHCMGST